LSGSASIKINYLKVEIKTKNGAVEKIASNRGCSEIAGAKVENKSSFSKEFTSKIFVGHHTTNLPKPATGHTLPNSPLFYT
jgi:hypothetical protein